MFRPSPAHPASSLRPSLLVPLALLVGYAALHVTARLLASDNLAEMDPIIELQARAWAWVYIPGEAPFYTWIIRALETVVGPGVVAFQLVKYTSVVVCGLGLYATALRLTDNDKLWSLLAVEALALIYQLSWRLHEGFASELLAFAAVPLITLQLIRIAERRRLVDFVGLGLAAALALEATGPARACLGVLVAAALLQPNTRRALLRPALLLTGLIALPAALHVASLEPVWRHGLFAPVTAIGWLDQVVVGPALFLSPHLPILLVLFPAMLPALVRRAPPPADPDHPDVDRLLGDATLLGIAALALAAALGLVGSYPVQWIGPLFLMTTTWATGRARRAARWPWQTRTLIALGLTLATFAFGLRLANMVVQQPVCKICRWGVPYAALADRLAAQAPGALLVSDGDTGGNLVRFFPHIPVVAPPATAADLAALPRPVVVVWADRRPPLGLERLIANQPIETVLVPWPGGLIARAGRATSTWRFVTLP